jgi:hypothetical protein
MLSPYDILGRIKRKPFTPMRIITSAGEHYDIYHPDLIMVGKRYLVVGTVSEDNPSIFDKSTMVTLQEITAIENLPAPAAPQPEGDGK